MNTHTHTYIALLNFGVKYVIVNETRDILSSGQFLWGFLTDW